MSNIKSLAIVAAAATLFPSAVGAFDASSNSNVAVYWGQGPNQLPLAHFCTDPNIDIINIGFLNQFPDQTGGYPGSNFGNQCGDETYKNKDGSASKLLSNCPSIGPDIVACQNAGKKVLLSLGGAIPSNQHIDSDTTAEAFANFLWTSFGPVSDPTVPRPFGAAVVDGFDFDIESVLVTGEDKGDLSRGYSTLINTLRSYFEFESSKTFYISGAPQCIVPDAHLADAIETSFFDFIFVQFYNTQECSARAYFDPTYGGSDTNITFDAWVDFVHQSGLNKKAKVYLGLPASTSSNVVYAPEMYLSPNEAKEIIKAFQCKYPNDFGGVMIYEATASENNAINGQPYADILKKDLVEDSCSNHASASSSAPASTKATSAVSSPIASSSAPATSSAVAVSSSGAILPSGLAPPSSAPYPIPSGLAPSSGPTGSSGVIVPSGSAPAKSGTAPYKTGSAPYKTGTAPHSIKIGTAPHTISTGTAPSASATVVPSGASSGSLPSVSPSSGAPYPVSHSSLPAAGSGSSSPTSSEENSPTSTGEEVVSVTDVVTITSCAPEVTNCPARSHPLVSTEILVSTIVPGSSPSTPAGGASVSSSPGNSPQSTQEVVTTENVTSYLTTCPVTQTATSGGSQIIQTGSTVSTVYSTITSTICTRCVAPSTPAPTQKAISSPASLSLVTGNKSPSASIQEVVTTVIEHTTLTTCPVTNTITSGTSEILQITQSVSTVISTTTSTICTKCVAPATHVPAPVAPGPNSPSNTAIIGIPGSGHQGPPEAVPVGSSSAGSSSPSRKTESGAQGSHSPTKSAASGSSGSSPASHGSVSLAGSNGSPTSAQQSPAPVPVSHNSAHAGNGPASHESQSGAQGGSSQGVPAGQTPAASPATASPAGPVTIQSTVNIIPIQTLTIVPIPVSPIQTALSVQPSESAQQGSSAPGSPQAPTESGAQQGNGKPGSGAPFPANNGTVPASPSGSASPSQGTSSPSPAQPSVAAFKGAASRTDTGAFGIVVFVITAVLVL